MRCSGSSPGLFNFYGCPTGHNGEKGTTTLQSQLNPILSAIRSLFSRFYGTLPDLHDLSHIILMSQQLYGYTHELILDLTRNDGYAWITETVEDIPIDDGWLSDAVTWLDEADVDEMRRPSNLAVKTCWILANG